MANTYTQILSAWLTMLLRLVSDPVALRQKGRLFKLWTGQKDSVPPPRALPQSTRKRN